MSIFIEISMYIVTQVINLITNEIKRAVTNQRNKHRSSLSTEKFTRKKYL